MDSALYQYILGYNMFLYCYNNPVTFFDPTGERAVSIFWAWLTGGGAVAAAEPTFVGEIILAAGAVVLGTVVVVEKIVSTVQNISSISKAVKKSQSKTKDKASTDDSKDKDSRLKGKPGDVNKEGSKETLIGPDGRATRERHWTDHVNPKKHSIPHDHDITWDANGNPVFGPPQNYSDGTIPVFP